MFRCGAPRCCAQCDSEARRRDGGIGDVSVGPGHPVLVAPGAALEPAAEPEPTAHRAYFTWLGVVALERVVRDLKKHS